MLPIRLSTPRASLMDRDLGGAPICGAVGKVRAHETRFDEGSAGLTAVASTVRSLQPLRRHTLCRLGRGQETPESTPTGQSDVSPPAACGVSAFRD